jgi:transcriptional regulator with XRE-family HTH domain
MQKLFFFRIVFILTALAAGVFGGKANAGSDTTTLQPAQVYAQVEQIKRSIWDSQQYFNYLLLAFILFNGGIFILAIILIRKLVKSAGAVQILDTSALDQLAQQLRNLSQKLEQPKPSAALGDTGVILKAIEQIEKRMGESRGEIGAKQPAEWKKELRPLFKGLQEEIEQIKRTQIEIKSIFRDEEFFNVPLRQYYPAPVGDVFSKPDASEGIILDNSFFRIEFWPGAKEGRLFFIEVESHHKRALAAMQDLIDRTCIVQERVSRPTNIITEEPGKVELNEIGNWRIIEKIKVKLI